ncbi:uncharacterized protein GGS25DRAFT_516793 [Hypoxylon fragiforme]|uniref:uncharacterized protein n=1 Tax=Hypoxylon fragiforme TaxID=63214 RepID=UPI0020C5D45B|nr:uncharacterized protein GGS25DRAFT_516793 [Hypoxylon fragiforme]KAI2613935.1 hypothetical protein GGS25DRAFT_516793 [Hypoxylon fragiforme]
MAGKISLPLTEEKRPVRNCPRRRHRSLLIATLIAALVYGLYDIYLTPALNFLHKSYPSASFPSSIKSDDAVPVAQALVPLEAHIMSKCPDAKDCLKEMVLPAMMRVSDKVDFTLSYIGTPTENDGVSCKHGPGECMGNILELCAHHLYPDPKIYLGFTMCLTREYKLIPQRELVEDCALEHAIDFEKLNDCAAKDDGAFGMAMLRESVRRTADVRERYEELHGQTK